MEPTRIHISDELRDALAKATVERHQMFQARLEVLNERYENVPANYVSEQETHALSEAVLDVLESGNEELQSLCDKVLETSSGAYAPALIIENLPENDETTQRILRGFSALYTSNWQAPSSTVELTRKDGKGTETLPREGPHSHVLRGLEINHKDVHEHGKQDLHMDYNKVRRQGVSTMLRFLRVRQQSNPKLKTAICSADEVIHRVADRLYPEVQDRFETKEAFCTHIGERLSSEDWTLEGYDRYSTLLKNDAFNPENPGSCRYGFAAITEEDLLSTSDDPLDEKLMQTYYEEVKAMKYASGATLEPTEILIFNNALVLHGAGAFEAVDPSKPESNERLLENYFADGNAAAPEHEAQLRERHGFTPRPEVSGPAYVVPSVALPKGYLDREKEGEANAKVRLDTPAHAR